MGKLRPGRGRGLPRGSPGTRNQVFVQNSPLDERVPKPAQAMRGRLQEMDHHSCHQVLASDVEGQEGSTCHLVSSYYVPVLPEAWKGRQFYSHVMDEETEVPRDKVT